MDGFCVLCLDLLFVWILCVMYVLLLVRYVSDTFVALFCLGLSQFLAYITMYEFLNHLFT